MSAYHSYDGVPAVADKHALTDILRDEWGYQYFVSSAKKPVKKQSLTRPSAQGYERRRRYGPSLRRFQDVPSRPHRFEGHSQLCKCVWIIDMTSINASRQALPAGNDVEMGGGSFNFEKIPEMVEAGELDIAIVDQAVSRQLRAKFAAGLFEDPFPGVPEEEQADYINTPELVELARQLDAESIVLLENHDDVLPLKKDASIAVIGPMAHGYMNVSPSRWRKLSCRGHFGTNARRSMAIMCHTRPNIGA